MPRNKRKLPESLTSVFESWGIPLIRAKARAQQAEVRVYLPIKSDEADTKKILIGTLFNESGEFVFRYAKTYIEDEKALALSAFPDKKKEYRSKQLWPFFEVRIPSVNREDVRILMRDKKIDGGNTLRLLGELARKSITSPFELEFVDSAA